MNNDRWAVATLESIYTLLLGGFSAGKARKPPHTLSHWQVIRATPALLMSDLFSPTTCVKSASSACHIAFSNDLNPKFRTDLHGNPALFANSLFQIPTDIA